MILVQTACTFPFWFVVACTFHDFGSFCLHFSILVLLACTFHDFGSFSLHFSILVLIACTFHDFGSFSLLFSILVLIACTFHEFGSFCLHFSILVLIACTLCDFGSKSQHFVSWKPLLVEQNDGKKSLDTPKGYPGPTVLDVLYPMVPSKLSRPHFQFWFI